MGSGDITYEEFAEELWKMRSTDHSTVMQIVKHYARMIWMNTKPKQEHGKKTDLLNEEMRNRMQSFEESLQQINENHLGMHEILQSISPQKRDISIDSVTIGNNLVQPLLSQTGAVARQQTHDFSGMNPLLVDPNLPFSSPLYGSPHLSPEKVQ